MERDLIDHALADVLRERDPDDVSEALMVLATRASEMEDIDEAIECLGALETAVKSKHLLFREAERISAMLGLTLKQAKPLDAPQRLRVSYAAESVMAWLFHTVYLSFGEKSVEAISQVTLKSRYCS